MQSVFEVVLLVGLNSYDITIMVMTVDLRRGVLPDSV